MWFFILVKGNIILRPGEVFALDGVLSNMVPTLESCVSEKNRFFVKINTYNQSNICFIIRICLTICDTFS